MRIAERSILCVSLFSFGCSLIRNEYVVYVKIPNDCKVTEASRVLWEGNEVGRVNKIIAIDSNSVILHLLIQNQTKLPASSIAQCHENILGDAVIDISSTTKLISKQIGYLHSQDTLQGKYVDQFHKLDSNEKEKVISKLKDLKKTLDSIVRDSISK